MPNTPHPLIIQQFNKFPIPLKFHSIIKQMLPSILSPILITLLTFLHTKIKCFNYITNGDFQIFTPSTQFTGLESYKYSYYKYSANSTYKWYIQANITLQFQVRTKNDLFTNILDLIPNSPQSTCQNMTIQESGNYQLNFSYLIDNNLQNSGMAVRLNDQVLKTEAVSSKVPVNYNNVLFVNAMVNVLCFQGYHSLFFNYPFFGVGIDNVTFTKYYYPAVVQVDTKYLAYDNQILAKTDYIWPMSWNISDFSQNSVISVDSQVMSNVTLYVDSTGHLSINISYLNTLNPMNISITLPKSLLSNSTGHFVSFLFSTTPIVTFKHLHFNVSSFYSKQDKKITSISTLIMQKAWKNTINSTYIQISLNSDKSLPVLIKNYTIATETNGSITFILFLNNETILPSSVISISILNNTLLSDRNQVLTFIGNFNTIQQVIELGPIYSENQIKFIEDLNKTSAKSIQAIYKSASAVELAGFNYMISSLLAFFSLTFLFHYVPYNCVLAAYANLINVPVEKGMKYAALSNLIGNNQVWRKLNEIDERKQQLLPDHSENAAKLLDFGFTSRFWSNNQEDALNLLLAVIKISIVRLLCYLPISIIKLYAEKAVKIFEQLIIFEFVVMGPAIALPLSTMLSRRSHIAGTNVSECINNLIFVVFGLVCLISPFLLWIISFNKNSHKNPQTIRNFNKQRNRTRTCRQMVVRINITYIHKEKRENSVKNTITKQQKNATISLIENCMYFCLPMIAGQFSTVAYTVGASLVVAGRMLLLIKWRHIFSRWQFIKQFGNRVLWISYCGIYIVYFFIDLLGCTYEQPDVFKILRVCGIAQIILFLTGLALEVLHLLIEISLIAINIIRFYKRLYFNNSINQAPKQADKIEGCKNEHLKCSHENSNIRISQIKRPCEVKRPKDWRKFVLFSKNNDSNFVLFPKNNGHRINSNHQKSLFNDHQNDNG